MTLVARIKREWRFKLVAWREWKEAWQTWLDQKRCPHIFRPVRTGKRLGQICDACDHLELLSKEEFFALYGECGQFNQ